MSAVSALQMHGPITRVALDGICSGQLRWQELQTDDAEVDIIIRWWRVLFLERLVDGLAGANAFFFLLSCEVETAARLTAFFFKAATLPGEVSTVLCVGLRPRFERFLYGAACRGPISSKTGKRLVEDALNEKKRVPTTSYIQVPTTGNHDHSRSNQKKCDKSWFSYKSIWHPKSQRKYCRNIDNTHLFDIIHFDLSHFQNIGKLQLILFLRTFSQCHRS